MLPVVLPADKQVFIHASPQRCVVSRYVQTGPYTFGVEASTNWQTLEPAARQAVEDQVGAITEPGHYSCPEALAARAVWP